MRVHFIGIGGVSMSALARLTLAMGHTVSGSDLKFNSNIPAQATFFEGHNAQNIVDADLVVYTAAIKGDNPELVAARKWEYTTIERAQYLAQIESKYAKSVAISGTHGKTTTTALIARCLAPLDPTVHLGGTWQEIGGNLRIGSKDIFVTEACEYNRSMLELNPYIGVILNIEFDHPDTYANVYEMQLAFEAFAKKVRHTLVVANTRETVAVAEKSGKSFVTIGMQPDSTYCAQNIGQKNGCFYYDCKKNGAQFAHIALCARGSFNVQNSLAAVATADLLGIDCDTITSRLSGFLGVERRFEEMGFFGGARVICDYAHHPTEIACAIKTARYLTQKKIFVVFQPHTFSRTITLYDSFVQALKQADSILLLPTYRAREIPQGGFREQTLSEGLQAAGKNAQFFHYFGEVFQALKAQVEAGDVILILGAGDVVLLNKFLVN